MILNMFNKIILVFTICLFIFSNNSCQTFDDLQFDNLALRGQIDSLSQRITVLTDEILEQKANYCKSV
jgi:cell division protein FtsB